VLLGLGKKAQRYDIVFRRARPDRERACGNRRPS
jgi:hypothetical protein